MLCQFLIYNEVNQIYAYIYIYIYIYLYLYIPSLLDLPPTTLTIPSPWDITVPWTGLPVLCKLLPSYLFYTQSFICINPNLLICPPLPLPPCVHSSALYVCISIPTWKQVHLYHFSRFHIYASICNICFSPSDLLHSV